MTEIMPNHAPSAEYERGRIAGMREASRRVSLIASGHYKAARAHDCANKPLETALAEALDNAAIALQIHDSEPTIYGSACPSGKVQVEFIGVDPLLKQGEYGWKPSDSAFIELWIDGQRFRMDAGWVTHFNGTRSRGLNIIFPLKCEVNKDSVNAVSLTFPATREKLK